MLKDYLGIFGFVLLIQMAITDALMATNFLSYTFSLLIAWLSIMGFVIKSGTRTGTAFVFMPVAVFLVSIMLGSGYLVTYLHITPDLISGSRQIAGLSLLFGEFGTVVSAIFLNGKSYTTHLELAGYDELEVRNFLNGYSLNLTAVALVSVGITFILLLLAGAVPFLNIGLLPAILLFGFVYIVIFRVLIAERRVYRK